MRVPNTLKRHHHHHYHRHRHHQFGFYSIISHRKISRMVLVIFMIHLCTIATLMFVQNNTSQKILIIAARTIQFPGVVFKVCIYIIVCHRHLKLYISMSKVPILIENIYISNQLVIREKGKEKKRKKTDSRNGLGRAPTYNRKILRRVSTQLDNLSICHQSIHLS